MEPIRYAPTLSTDTTRTMSNAIWKDCPWTDIDSGAVAGQRFFDDFTVIGSAGSTSGGALAASAGQWATYAYQGSTITDAAIEGGGITLASDGDSEGVTLLSQAGTFQFIEANSTTAPVPHKRMWFEARVKRSTITQTKSEFFVGLMAPTLSSGLPAAAQPITATDDTLMTAGSLFGFHCNSTDATRGGPTEVAVAFVKASGTVNYPTNMTTLLASTGQTVLAADTWVKLGWVYDSMAYDGLVTSATGRQTAGTLRRKLIRFFVNGKELPAFLASDDLYNATSGQLFPIVPMCPVISHMNTTGSTPGTTTFDWIRVASLSYT